MLLLTSVLCITIIRCLVAAAALETKASLSLANDILNDTVQSQTHIIPDYIIHPENLLFGAERSSI